MNSEQPKEAIYQLISQSKIEEALKLMQEKFLPYKKRIALLQADFHDYKKKLVGNLASNEQLSVYLSKLNYRALNLLDEIEQREKVPMPVKGEGPMSTIARILAHQIDFLKSTIKKLIRTRRFVLSVTLTPMVLFGIVYFLFKTYLNSYSILLLSVTLLLFCLANACLTLLINNLIESFNHNKVTLKLHQNISDNIENADS